MKYGERDLALGEGFWEREPQGGRNREGGTEVRSEKREGGLRMD